MSHRCRYAGGGRRVQVRGTGRAGRAGKRWRARPGERSPGSAARGAQPGERGHWLGGGADWPGTSGATGSRVRRIFAIMKSDGRSRGDIDKDLGAVGQILPQALMCGLDEFLVDLETAGPAAEAPGRDS